MQYSICHSENNHKNRKTISISAIASELQPIESVFSGDQNKISLGKSAQICPYDLQLKSFKLWIFFSLSPSIASVRQFTRSTKWFICWIFAQNKYCSCRRWTREKMKFFYFHPSNASNTKVIYATSNRVRDQERERERERMNRLNLCHTRECEAKSCLG